MSASGSTSFWQSVLNSKKAIFAGSATVVAWIGGVLEGNGGHNLTTVQWIIAAGAFLGAHAGTYSFTNEKPPLAPVVTPVVSVPVEITATATTPIDVINDPAVVAAQAQLDTSLAAMNDTMAQLQSVSADSSSAVSEVPAVQGQGAV